MIRSLRTGVSGLKSHQVRMDVISNNIANVNTTAFKRGRAAFNELLGQTLLGVGRTAGGRGINPAYVGLGVSVGSIDVNFAQGALENTGVATDLGINGDGFFVVRGGDRIYLTRAGNFTINRFGELVTNSGLQVQGWAFDENGELRSAALEDVRVPFSATAPPKQTENIYVRGNLNAELAAGESVTVSTVVYDPQGKAKTIIIEFTRTSNPNEWQWNLLDEDGNPLGVTITSGDNLITFDTQGNLDPTEALQTFDWDIDNDGTLESFTLNLAGADDALTQYAGSTTATVRDQDGQPPGSLIGFSINQEGIVELNFSNGYQQKIYQLALGSVNNVNGLQQVGDNLWSLTSSSGDLALGRAGVELNRTVIVAGTLEMSNVDLATEFTDMIVTQRGYQASARIITTSDEMLQELVQLKR
ncbi:flagellar hook protein FlgE [Rhodothermus marinus]|uniref:flagellar hook protein FlgE n=1 Tax=Rhodothermus marinus TaxID=29549 RepID=UPI0012BA40EF|nr:flagellar hook protein FlgE [Rhodothermus marinus]BBM68965.1 flagellar hook protein FlgE [Rhodothermus marinus]BBM71943.1 flagellar hook protein FlgE [Rhodothermus marinus]